MLWSTKAMQNIWFSPDHSERFSIIPPPARPGGGIMENRSEWSGENHIFCINFVDHNIVHCDWLSHFRRARRFVFDYTRGLYQTAVNWIQHTFHASRVLLSNSLGTPDLPKLLARILHGPWNRKFSAPSSSSSKLENCVHPPKIGLNMGFVRRKVYLRKGVRPALAAFPLFLGI